MKRIVAISCPHVGSAVGLAGPDMGTTDADYPIRQKIWELYQRAVTGPWGKPDILFLLGDLLDGQNPKGSGEDVLAVNLKVQKTKAIKYLKQWGAKTVYCVSGSGYHVEAGHTGLRMEEDIAVGVGAEEVPGQDTMEPEERRHTAPAWKVTVEDTTFHLQHWVSVNKGWNRRFTGITSETMNQLIKKALNKEVERYPVDVVVRGHVHRYAMIHSDMIGVTVPGWKAKDAFVNRAGQDRMISHIGFVGFKVDGRSVNVCPSYAAVETVQATPHSFCK